MQKMTRRDSLAWLAPISVLLGTDEPVPAAKQQVHQWAQISPREQIRARYFPNLVLTTQENKEVRLYEDLIKDKVMILNFLYTSCGRICPRVTQNLVKVQKLLGDRMGSDIFIYSFTLDPVQDTPTILKEYAKTHHISPGWQLLTGKPEEMEFLRQKLGFVDPDPDADKDKENHIGNIRYGNEARQLWGACPGLSRPEFIVESLTWVKA